MSFFSGLLDAAKQEGAQYLQQALAGQDPATQALLDKLGLDKVIEGLKEALIVGIDKAVEVCGVADGYFGNPHIKIPLPPALDMVGKKISENELGAKLVNAFEESMNRAAEHAAPKALDVVKGAIRDMSFDDVKRVWKGGDHSCTDFLRSTCNEPLKAVMKDECESVLESNKVTHYYAQIVEFVEGLPVIGDLAKQYDIKDYTLQKALDGLYFKMADEEKNIRNDPAHRTTELLSQVFGSSQ